MTDMTNIIDIINPNFYNIFGILVENNIFENSLILTGINFNENNFSKLHEMFKNILSGKKYNVNIIELNLLLTNVCLKNRNIILKMIDLKL